MTHWGWVRRRLRHSARLRLGVMVLAFIALPAVFAELWAADAPIIAVGTSGVMLLPAIIEPDRHDGLDRRAIAELHAHDATVWPLVRCGPESSCAIGANAPSSWSHPLGTDGNGRDVFARLIYGARSALGLALAAIVLSVLFGGFFGALAGWVGGFWDEMLSRPVEFIQAFPAIIVVALVRAIVDDSTMWSLLVAVAAVRWAEVARLVRAEVVRTAGADFVTAARALGCGRIRILRRHILPYALRPVVVSSMFAIASIVMLEVAVSFLGLGTRGSWGTMIADGLVSEGGARSAMWAGVSLAVTVLAAYLIADATEEALDSRVGGAIGSPRSELRARRR